MQIQNRSTLQISKARWKVTSPTGKIKLSLSRTNLFKQQEERGIVQKNLLGGNIMQLLIHRGEV
jgi:hypothetical protein